MDAFLKHVPEAHHASLREAVEAVGESKVMLHEVEQRFGTTDPAELEARIGETCSGIVISGETVAALRELWAAHEARREACRRLMANLGRDLPPSEGEERS